MFNLSSTGTLGSFSLAQPVCAGLCLCPHRVSWGSYHPISAVFSACGFTWIYLPPCQPFSLVWFQLHTCEGYIQSVTQVYDLNADCFWFQNWTLILWKHQSSKLCSLAQMDVVRILSTELGVVSCAKYWKLWIYQRQIHQLISAKLRFMLPDLVCLKPELLLSPCLNSAAEVYNAESLT